jgi:hypothetical protein
MSTAFDPVKQFSGIFFMPISKFAFLHKFKLFLALLHINEDRLDQSLCIAGNFWTWIIVQWCIPGQILHIVQKAQASSKNGRPAFASFPNFLPVEMIVNTFLDGSQVNGIIDKAHIGSVEA